MDFSWYLDSFVLLGHHFLAEFLYLFSQPSVHWNKKKSKAKTCKEWYANLKDKIINIKYQ